MKRRVLTAAVTFVCGVWAALAPDTCSARAGETVPTKDYLSCRGGGRDPRCETTIDGSKLFLMFCGSERPG